MRIKTIATILLTAFVLVAFAVIVLRKPSQSSKGNGEPPRVPEVVSSAPPAAADDAPPVATVAETSTQPEPPAVDTIAEPRPAAAAARVAVSSPPANVPSPATHARKVVATYFHGNIRCTTCRKVEAYAREAVEEGFKPEVASGAVEFRAVNLEVAENAHFIQDYQLTNKSVVVTEEVDGVVARWAKLDGVWSLVGDRDRYHVYVQDAVRGYLEP